MVSTPAAPDPYKTAQAQSQWNNTTAQTQQALNMVDQTNPWGSSSYSQTGTQTIIGADGKPIQVPKYTQTTTLSPEQQAIFEQTQQAQGNLAGLASDQSAAMRDYLNTPFEYGVGEHEAWAGDLYNNLNQGGNDRQIEALRTQLVNQGVRPGTPAFDDAMRNATSSQATARDRFMLDSYNTGLSTALTNRNQPIQELSALMSGSQVSQPTFGATPQTGVGGVDYTGLVNNQYQAQSQQASAMNGGLFGLLGTGLSLFSDERLKADIRRVGATDEGVPVYTYRYVWGGPIMMGVMAQDVPGAAEMDPSGFLRVDYGKVN